MPPGRDRLVDGFIRQFKQWCFKQPYGTAAAEVYSYTKKDGYDDTFNVIIDKWTYKYYDGWIYYFDDSGLYRVKPDLTQKTLIY